MSRFIWAASSRRCSVSADITIWIFVVVSASDAADRLCCGGVEGFGGAGCDFGVYLSHFLASRTIVAVVIGLTLGNAHQVVERGEEVDYCVPECHGVRLRRGMR